jgi:predicted enzyme related to lactoylglutathione lyase
MPLFDRLVRFHMAVNDIDVTRDFYAEKLGFTVDREMSMGDVRWAFLELPGDGVSVLLTTDQQFMKPGGMKLYLSTSDIEAACEGLRVKGVVVPDEVRRDDWATWFDFQDPDGNQVIVTG